jgi:guanylate kinase
MNVSGSLFIISAPSGTGKTSLVKAVCQKLPNIKKSVSHTTREMRVGEQDGVHYNFVSREQFNHILENEVFLEHAEVFGNHYGTSQQWVLDTLKGGDDVILEIDWQGAQQIKQKMPDAIAVFILPPSDEVLRQRLVSRKQDDTDKIALRLGEARTDVSHYNEYDYLIVNDDFDLALQQLIGVISAARLRVNKQKFILKDLIDDLCHNS